MRACGPIQPRARLISNHQTVEDGSMQRVVIVSVVALVVVHGWANAQRHDLTDTEVALIAPQQPQVESRIPDGAASGLDMPEITGLTKDWFGRLGQNLIYPYESETAKAIQRMARGQVSSIRNRCAGTMREALGWGLGDAHRWTSLPSRGYTQRPAGASAQPGDIVVWPFSYGSRNSQHIGIAVGTEKGLLLLSNLSGSLGLSRMAPGYRAYYK
jgi:hypothetical protein